jgi:A/G-specific adenine glycosylase
MLQQTQVATVTGYYQRWLDRFPTVGDLADAEEASVLVAWQGLGYYRRARNLHRCAKIIVRQFAGHFPSTVDELMQFPGIGRYTAGAIVSFAFDRPAPIVDANIARLLTRLRDIRQPIDTARGRKMLWELAERFARCTDPGLSNAALMELGAIVCMPRNPHCRDCPVQTFCLAKDPKALPRKRRRPSIEQRNEDYFFAERDGQVLLERRAGERWQGLWTLPLLSQAAGAMLSEPAFVRLRHPITRFTIDLRIFVREAPVNLGDGQEWKPLASIEDLPMPAPHRRGLKLALLKRSASPQKSLSPNRSRMANRCSLDRL